MYQLLKGLYNLYFEKPTVKILIIGPDNVGKSYLLNTIKIKEGIKTIPNSKIISTIG